MPYTFFTPYAPARDAPTRRQRIVMRYPQADAALRRIEDSAADLPYGSSIDAVLNSYHFPSETDVREYFEVYLQERQGGDGPVDIDLINKYTYDTINLIPDKTVRNKYTTDKAFCDIYEELLRQIQLNADENTATVNLVIGPTGSGKTAFSKSLFTVCMQKFWVNKIIPSRVEYSKYQIPENADVIGAEADRLFFDFVRRCQLRDLLIYFFISGMLTYDEKLDHIAALKNPALERPLVDLLEETENIVFDGDTVILDPKIRGRFTLRMRSVKAEDRNRLLYELSTRLGVRFLVSFDGFDSTKIEHFLFEKGLNLPIYYLVRLLKGIHEKAVDISHPSQNVESHYIAYLRDTTFNHLKTELIRGIGSKVEYPCYWIVPPKYSQLVSNVARFITRTQNDEENLSTKYSTEIYDVFDREIFPRTGMSANKHMSFIFGSSGRRMKNHIRQTLVSAIHRMSQGGNYEFERLSSGTGARLVWQDVVGSDAIKSLQKYIVLEDLFLNDSRQLLPKLELDPGVVTKLIDTGDFDGIIKHITDADELGGVFGCLFNYFYRKTIGSEGKAQPALLLLVRIAQFIEKNPRCNADEVGDFLHRIGYVLSDDALRFCLFVILRSELVKWDGTAGAKTVSDVPLYITTLGSVALNRLLFSITYLSEAFLSSIQIDRKLAGGLRRRDPDLGYWIADSINNASVALMQIRSIEEIEEVNARKSGVEFSAYVLAPRLEELMRREAAAIARSLRGGPQMRFRENAERLRQLRISYPSLVMLGESS